MRAESGRTYAKRIHNLFLDNCYHHTALCLNLMRFEGRTDWNVWNLTWR